MEGKSFTDCGHKISDFNPLEFEGVKDQIIGPNALLRFQTKKLAISLLHPLEIRIFPRLWNRAIISIITEKQ